MGLPPCRRGHVPKGPKGRSARQNVIGNAFHIMRIATGEIADDTSQTGKEYAHKGGLIGDPKRAAKLSKQRRAEIAHKAARARCNK
jgi:hypothetical protein